MYIWSFGHLDILIIGNNRNFCFRLGSHRNTHTNSLRSYINAWDDVSLITQNLLISLNLQIKKEPSMAPSAPTSMLSHPLIQQTPTNNTLQPQQEPPSQLVKSHLPARNSSESSGRSKFSLWLFGDPATYDKRFQEAIELSCSWWRDISFPAFCFSITFMFLCVVTWTLRNFFSIISPCSVTYTIMKSIEHVFYSFWYLRNFINHTNRTHTVIDTSSIPTSKKQEQSLLWTNTKSFTCDRFRLAMSDSLQARE